MIGPYLLKLFCLCLASFFVVNALSGIVVLCVSRVAVKIAEGVRPRIATRFLFFARLFPCLLGIALVMGLCVPSYLRFEPEETFEHVGCVCLVAAVLGGVSWVLACLRAARALADSHGCQQKWRDSGYETRLPGAVSRALLVQRESPLLALTGVIRPRPVVSQVVLRSLSCEQLALALEHENAHAASRDNLKRLLLLLAPDSLPFVRGFAALEQAWAKFCEWAADDDAVQGDPRRAITLAATLVRVARIGISPRLTFLHTSLIYGGELSERVDRLLQGTSVSAKQSRRTRSLAIFMGLGAAVLVVSFAAFPAALASVHRLLELFLR